MQTPSEENTNATPETGAHNEEELNPTTLPTASLPDHEKPAADPPREPSAAVEGATEDTPDEADGEPVGEAPADASTAEAATETNGQPPALEEAGAEMETATEEEEGEDAAYAAYAQTVHSLYDKKHADFNKEGFDEDVDQFEKARQKYKRWRAYVLELTATYEDELCFSFLDLLDTHFPVLKKKDRRVVTLPLTEFTEQGEEALKQQAGAIQTSVGGKDLQESLQALSKVNVRIGGDEFKRIDEDQIPDDAQARVFLKKTLDTLLLIYKQLEGRRPKLDMLKLLGWMLEREHTLYTPLSRFEACFGSLFLEQVKPGEGPAQPDAFEHEINEQITEVLRKNYQQVTEARAIADKLQERYFDFLKKVLFRVYNSLREAHLHYKATLKNQFGDADVRAQLEAWGQVYQQLMDLTKNYLKEKLDIIPFVPIALDELDEDEKSPDKVDFYDPARHEPYTEPERDENLQTDQIKRVVNAGFQYVPEDAEGPPYIKLADVILVRN